MDVLKRRVMQMKIDIDNADEKYKRIRRELKSATERADQSEAEAECLKKKRDFCIHDLEKAEDAFEVRILRIKAQEEVADDSEKERKDLEQTEYNQHDKLVILGMEATKARKYADEMEQKCREAVERLKLVQRDSHKARGKASSADGKIAYLEEEYDIGMRALMKKEWLEQGSSRKEEIYEDKVDFLELKYRHTVVAADDHEQEARVLEIQKEKMKAHVLRQKKKLDALRRELEDAVADLSEV